MTERDAFDITRDEARSTLSRVWNQMLDYGRRLVTGKLLAILVGTFGFVVAARFFLPALVAAGCAVGLVLLGGWAIQTQRLLNRERERRHWTTIDGLRVRQGEIRAQIALREATLIVGDLRGGRGAQFNAYRPLLEAVRYLRGTAQAASRGSVASPRGDDVHVPKAPDVGPVERELKDLREQDELVESEIQAIAAPGTEWEEKAAEKKAAYQRAKRASLEARKRARSGRRPTDNAPGFAFEIGRNRDGSRRVSKRPADLTPEQIFRDEGPDEPTAR